MSWNQTTQMEEIIRFVTMAQSDRFTLTELCEQFCISRKTGLNIWRDRRRADSGVLFWTA